MNAQVQAQSRTLSLSSDLLTGAEWSAAHVQELFRLAAEVKADLLVVGNVGLATRSDKWLGSVPGNVLRRAKTDVLLVHTTD